MEQVGILSEEIEYRPVFVFFHGKVRPMTENIPRLFFSLFRSCFLQFPVET